MRHAPEDMCTKQPSRSGGDTRYARSRSPRANQIAICQAAMVADAAQVFAACCSRQPAMFVRVVQRGAITTAAVKPAPRRVKITVANARQASILSLTARHGYDNRQAANVLVSRRQPAANQRAAAAHAQCRLAPVRTEAPMPNGSRRSSGTNQQKDRARSHRQWYTEGNTGRQKGRVAKWVVGEKRKE